MQEGTHSFDLIIIGGGSAGFAAAIKANELGAKTLMINLLWHTHPNFAFGGSFVRWSRHIKLLLKKRQ